MRRFRSSTGISRFLRLVSGLDVILPQSLRQHHRVHAEVDAIFSIVTPRSRSPIVANMTRAVQLQQLVAVTAIEVECPSTK